MSISPQFVCSTSVTGLSRGSSVVGFERCCAPLFLGLAAEQPEPLDGACAAVEVVAGVLAAAVDVVLLVSFLELFPQPAATSSGRAATMAKVRRDMAAQDNHGPRG